MKRSRYTSFALSGLLGLALLLIGATPALAQQFTPTNYCPSSLGAKYEIKSDGSIVYEDAGGGVGDIFDLTVTDTKSDGDVLEIFWQFKIDDDATSSDYVVEAFIEKGGPDIQQETFASPTTSGTLASNDGKGISFFILCVSETQVPCVAVSLSVEAVAGSNNQFKVNLTSEDGIRKVEFRDVFGGTIKLNNVEIAGFTGNLVEVTPGVDYEFDPNQFASLSTTASFTLQQVDPSVNTASFMVVSANACGTVAFDPPLTFPTAEAKDAPAFALTGNAPNPFRDRTTIGFELDAPSDVELTVFNLLGQQVVRQSYGGLPAGVNSIQWDGRSSAGQSLASGTYFYRLTAGTRSLNGRLMLVR